MEEQQIRVKTPRGREMLGVVESLLGSNKMMVRCQDDKMRICRIPGKMRKRIWIKERDVIILEPWTIQSDERGDVVWKYSPTDASWLRRNGLLKMDL